MEKFNKEIRLLKNIGSNENSSLHPLRKEQIKRAVLEKISQGETKIPGQRLNMQERKINMFKYIASSLVGILVLGGTAFAASGNAKPGDALFPIKKFKENLQVQMASNDQAKAQLQMKIAEERLEDLKDINTKVQTSASATTAQPDLVKNEGSLKIKAETEGELSDALEHLLETKEKLKAHGDLNAAAQINSAINNIKLKTEPELETDAPDVEVNSHLQTIFHKNDDEGKNDTNDNEVHINGEAGLHIGE